MGSCSTKLQDVGIDSIAFNKTKLGKHRQLNEFIATETSYVDLLKTGIECYCKPLKHSNLYQQYYDILFPSHIETIANLHSGFLKALKNNSNKDQIGSILLPFLPFFKMYETYDKQWRTAQYAFEKLRSSDKGFNEWHDEHYKLTISLKNPITLSGFLISPIQRIARFEMLLKECLLQSDFDTENLKICYKKICSTNEAIYRYANSFGKHINAKFIETSHSSSGSCHHISNCFHAYIHAVIQASGKAHNKLTPLVNHYIHLLLEHNDDNDFQYIMNKFGDCDINTCKAFRRNYENKSVDDSKIAPDAMTRVQCEILDKIHCFYAHSIHTGNRLLNRNEMKTNCFQRTHLLLNKQRSAAEYIDIKSNTKLKYHQIDLKLLQTFEVNAGKTYSFGVKFNYVEDDGNTGIKVSPKYSSIKEELITNNISSISLVQFNTEHNKSLIHYNTKYRKKQYTTMNIENLFALMIYCNYTNLQTEFSKTYYLTDKINQHNAFYHLAFNLKKTIHKFGTQIIDGQVKSFYHGIGQKSSLPQIIGDNGYGVIIYSPLSTSSSIAVAVNFTNNHNGLVLTFKDGGKHMSWTKYFSVSWLSDYANESEYLFIQNEDVMKICNIIEPATGYEFYVILKALNILDKITNDQLMDHEITNTIRVLISQIISHQLSNNIISYQTMEQLHPYGKLLINTYCNNKTQVKINLYKQQEYSFLFDLLVSSECKSINVNWLNVLFPNLEWIEIKAKRICSSMLVNIYNHLKDNSKLKIVWIRINKAGSNDITSDEYKKYVELLKGIKFNITETDGLYIEREKCF
eukprot:170864_1